MGFEGGTIPPLQATSIGDAFIGLERLLQETPRQPRDDDLNDDPFLKPPSFDPSAHDLPLGSIAGDAALGGWLSRLTQVARISEEQAKPNLSFPQHISLRLSTKLRNQNPVERVCRRRGRPRTTTMTTKNWRAVQSECGSQRSVRMSLIGFFLSLATSRRVPLPQLGRSVLICGIASKHDAGLLPVAFQPFRYSVV